MNTSCRLREISRPERRSVGQVVQKGTVMQRRRGSVIRVGHEEKGGEDVEMKGKSE
jgi:hypothetical protein